MLFQYSPPSIFSFLFRRRKMVHLYTAVIVLLSVHIARSTPVNPYLKMRAKNQDAQGALRDTVSPQPNEQFQGTTVLSTVTDQRHAHASESQHHDQKDSAGDKEQNVGNTGLVSSGSLASDHSGESRTTSYGQRNPSIVARLVELLFANQRRESEFLKMIAFSQNLPLTQLRQKLVVLHMSEENSIRNFLRNALLKGRPEQERIQWMNDYLLSRPDMGRQVVNEFYT